MAGATTSPLSASMASPMMVGVQDSGGIPQVAMRTTAVQAATKAEALKDSSRLSHLNEVIESAAHLLPAQGPITVFIHHNTLHGFEESSFHEAVMQGAALFGCQPYLTEDRYREELRRGRIRFDKLQTVLTRDLGDRAAQEVRPFGTRLELRLAMLQYPLRTGPTPELIWFVAEVNALRRVRSEASFAVRSRLIAETRRWVVRDVRGRVSWAAAGRACMGRKGSSNCWTDSAGRGSSRGRTTIGRASPCRLSGGRAATASETFRSSPRRRRPRSGTATCSWRRPAKTPTRWFTAC